MSDDTDLDRLLIVSPDTTVDIEAALEKLDKSRMRHVPAEELFPPGPRVGLCRICGTEAELSREHIPPRTAFNKARGRSPTFLDWYRTPGLEIPEIGPIFQGGVSGYVLCESCNNTTGRYGREYGIWAHGAALVMTGFEKSLEELDQLNSWAYGNVHLRDVYPGRFVRQAISIVLSVSGSSELSDRHPELRELALGGPAQPLPKPLRLFLGLYAGPMVRFAGGPWGQPMWSEESGVWTWAIEAAFPPFSIQLLVDGDARKLAGIDISKFAQLNPDAKHDFDIEGWMVGFGHLPHPLDFRPRGMLE